MDTQESIEMNYQLAQLGASFLIASSRWPLVQSKENVSSSPPWKLALENVPLLSDQFCENLIARRNIPFAISVARVLAINLQPNLLEKFGVSLNFIANQKLQETNSDNKMIVGNDEISSAFRKLCYFTLVKWSNKTFPPASTI